MISTMLKHLSNSFKSLRRNMLLSFAAISSVSVTLLVLGMFSSVIINTEKLTTSIEKNIQVNVYLSADSTDYLDQIKNDAGEMIDNPNYHKIFDQLVLVEGVDSISFSSKEKEIEKVVEVMGKSWKFLKGDSNPLRDVYIIKTEKPDQVKSVAKQVKKILGVDSVEYGGVNTDKIFKLSRFVRNWGFIGIVMLVVVAIFLISNTVRITIMSRSQEIMIMRLVGATNSYINWPFLLEGAWIGFIGSIIPFMMTATVYKLAYKSVNPELVQQGLSLYRPSQFNLYLLMGLILTGVIIGSIGSIGATRKYLKV